MYSAALNHISVIVILLSPITSILMYPVILDYSHECIHNLRRIVRVRGKLLEEAAIFHATNGAVVELVRHVKHE